MLISDSSDLQPFMCSLYLTDGRKRHEKKTEKVWLKDRKGRVRCEKKGWRKVGVAGWVRGVRFPHLLPLSFLNSFLKQVEFLHC